MTNPNQPSPRTSIVPRAQAHTENFYKAKLTDRVRQEAENKPFGWGRMRGEQLGVEVARKMLAAELGIEGRRVIRASVARAIYSTASFGFNGGNPELHIAGVQPSYRNIRLPRLDLTTDLSPQDRQRQVVECLDEQDKKAYPKILSSIEAHSPLTTTRVIRNARVLAECSLQLAAVGVTELQLITDLDIQNFAAMSANTLKTSVAMTTARDGVTPSIRQLIDRGSPFYRELIGHPIPEVSDLALDVCRTL